ncbi:P-loop NTPase [Streptomyces sp. NPDC005438]|uniref:AAA family ATPase n=1 Tax=Streptomyces sp. NPDC005438 TaxID=3156880 RepID=UPI0033AFF569
MVTRILPAVSDQDAARHVTTLLAQLPEAEPGQPVTDSTALLDTLATLARDGIADLPEVVLVHERIGPVPALELVREVALRFPAVGVILITQDISPGLYSAAMDAGARGLIGLPLSYDELLARVQSTSTWAVGVRRHLSSDVEMVTGPGGTVATVTGAKGGVGATFLSVQMALAACASGRSTALVDLDVLGGDVAAFLDIQFRRSIADMSEISEISPRVLQDCLFNDPSGVSVLLAPAESERGEDVSDRTVRQVLSVLRTRYEVVVVDTGSHMNAAVAAAIEMADTAALVTTPDVVAVRAAKRMVRMWERLQIRKAEETSAVVNRATRNTEIQPALVERIVGTPVAQTTVPAHFKELQPSVDAGRVQDLESKSTVRQASWALAGELGLVASAAQMRKNGRGRGWNKTNGTSDPRQETSIGARLLGGRRGGSQGAPAALENGSEPGTSAKQIAGEG